MRQFDWSPNEQRCRALIKAASMLSNIGMVTPTRSPSPLVPAADLVAVLTTLPSADIAKSIAETLVREHLAACVNTLAGVASTYQWNQQLTHDVEVLCLIKTQRQRLPALVARLQELHPYELPEVLVVEAQSASAVYRQWVLEATCGGGQ